MEELRKKHEADPTDSAAAIALAEALAKAKNVEEAVRVLGRTGGQLQKRGRTLEAVAIYKKVLLIDPRLQVASTFLIQIDLKRLLAESAKANASEETPPAKPAAPAGVKAPANAPAAADTSAARRRKESLKNAVLGIPLLKDVPPFLLELILDKVELRILEPPSLVFKEGDPGSSLFFVARGDLTVMVHDETGAEIVLGQLHGGDALGEISFLSGVPRTATIRVDTHAQLLELERASIEPILKRYRKLGEALQILFRERVLDTVLAKSRLCRTLPRGERERVAQRLMPLAAKAGDRIVKEGAADNVLYLLKRGVARVWTRHGGKEVDLATLRPHDVFGDVAALRGTPRTASVSAVTQVEFLCLAKPDLDELLARNPQIRADLEAIQLERFVENAQTLARP